MDELYRYILKINSWVESVPRAISEIKGVKTHLIRKIDYEWRNSVFRYFIDSTNAKHFGNDKEEQAAWDRLISEMAKRFDLSNEQVEILLEKSVPTEISNESFLPIKYDHKGTLVNVIVGNLTFSLPQKRLETFPRDEVRLARLFLRYLSLGPSSGLFWSLPPKTYQWIASSSTLPIIEGFASPFNNNLSNYCSAFTGDIFFGAKGSFFDVIASTNQPTRFVVNPPYTEYIANKSTDAVIDFLNRVQEGEIFIFFPAWEDLPLITMIREMTLPENIRGSYKSLGPHDYTVYNHLEGKYVNPPVRMIIGVLTGKNGDPETMLDQLYQTIRGEARTKK